LLDFCIFVYMRVYYINVSEWIVVVKRQFSNFQLYHFQWYDDEVRRFVLYQHAELDLYSANSLKQQSADRYVDPLGHIILIQS
jgi:hypothetical protein